MNISLTIDIFELYKNNLYTIKKLKNTPLPDIIDLKDNLFHFLMYIWHKNNNDDFCDKKLNYILIPHIDYDFSNFKTLRNYINIHHYIKYNIDPLFIKLDDIQVNIDECNIIEEPLNVIK